MQYLNGHFDAVLQIDHPLIHKPPTISRWRLYLHGVEVRSGSVQTSLPEPVRYVVDTVLTCWWMARELGRADVVVGLGVLNGMAALIARLLRISRQSVCWMIDYVPRRFPSLVMSLAFRAIDLVVCWRSDETWNVSQEIISAHEGHPASRILRHGHIARQKVVPIGVDRIVESDAVRVPYRLAFIGGVVEKQGLQLAIGALPALREHWPDVHLVVAGNGPYIPALKDLAKELEVDDCTDFRGFIDTDDEVWEILSTAWIGLAPYLHQEGSFTYFADPGKLKQYLAAGLPMCVTSVPRISALIEKEGCGIVVDDTVESLATGIGILLADPEIGQRRDACRAVARQFFWDTIFGDAMSGLPGE